MNKELLDRFNKFGISFGDIDDSDEIEINTAREIAISGSRPESKSHIDHPDKKVEILAELIEKLASTRVRFISRHVIILIYMFHASHTNDDTKVLRISYVAFDKIIHDSMLIGMELDEMQLILAKNNRSRQASINVFMLFTVSLMFSIRNKYVTLQDAVQMRERLCQQSDALEMNDVLAMLDKEIGGMKRK